jgi:hypothetical protein
MTAEETTETKPKGPMYGKSWKVSSRHMSFDAADKVRVKLTAESVSVKVQRMSDDTFVVKTRESAVKAAPDRAKSKGKPRTKSEKRKLRVGKQRQRDAQSE